MSRMVFLYLFKQTGVILVSSFLFIWLLSVNIGINPPVLYSYIHLTWTQIVQFMTMTYCSLADNLANFFFYANPSI